MVIPPMGVALAVTQQNDQERDSLPARRSSCPCTGGGERIAELAAAPRSVGTGAAGCLKPLVKAFVSGGG
jgi:hypothetical protein